MIHSWIQCDFGKHHQSSLHRHVLLKTLKGTNNNGNGNEWLYEYLNDCTGKCLTYSDNNWFCTINLFLPRIEKRNKILREECVMAECKIIIITIAMRLAKWSKYVSENGLKGSPCLSPVLSTCFEGQTWMFYWGVNDLTGHCNQMSCHLLSIYVILHLKDPQLCDLNVRHCDPLVDFSLSLSILHACAEQGQ